MQVLLDDISKIKEFVRLVNHSNCDIDLISGKNKFLDAKSILGVMSCNIHEPLTIEIIGSDEEKKLLIESIKDYIV